MHPRRHEVFRDVGSHRHEPEDDEFIELKEFLLKKDAAILLCSDGLSKIVPQGDLADLLARPETPAEHLVSAALERRADDNVTAVAIEVLPNAA